MGEQIFNDLNLYEIQNEVDRIIKLAGYPLVVCIDPSDKQFKYNLRVFFRTKVEDDRLKKV